MTPNDYRRESASPQDAPENWLADRLSRLPEVDVPEGLSDQIMAAIPPRRRPWWQTLLSRLSQPRTITFSPVKWAPVGAALALGLIIGFSLNRMPSEPVSTRGPHVAQSVYDADVHYQRGRKLLTANQAEEALVHLKRAADIHPDRALYQFWVGVNYWALQDYDEELGRYNKALAIDPGFLPAHVYSGHNYLDRGDWQTALMHYQRVLQDVPDHSEALFNSGLALRLQGDKRLENEAWRSYLDYYDRSGESMQAVEYLNANGDFSYRRIQLGMVALVKESIRFDDDDARLAKSSRATLDDIRRIIKRNHRLQLHIVSYAANDAPLAKLRAQAVERYMIDNNAEMAAQRIKTSWFGVPETVELADRSYQLENSIRLFATSINTM
jgi:tetratricopeptide (TPR) repeat protein